MRQLLLITYTSLFVIGILLFFYFIPKFTPESLGYGLPSSTLPKFLAGSISFFSCIEFIKTLKNKDDLRPSTIPLTSVINLVKFLTIAFATFPLMDFIGFIPGAILSIFALQLACGQRNFLILVSLSIGLALAIYFISTHVLYVALP